MTSEAAFLALRKDEDDDSTLAGSRIVGSDRSMEYSTSRDGASTVVSIDGVSLASSLFQGDRYFQEESVLPPEWSTKTNEARGRQFAKNLLEKSTTKRKKTGLLQRAVRAFRRRKTATRASTAVGKDKIVLQCTTSEEDDLSDGEITFDAQEADPWQDGTAWEGQTSTKITLPIRQESPPRDLDEISDCTSDATSHAGEVEVFLPSDASESPTDEEDDDTFANMLEGESPVSMPPPRRHHDQFFPDGLFVRTSAEDMVEKLKLGDAGRYALRRLDEATEAATKAFDPSNDASTNPDEIPALVTIAGYQVPDYKTYVRQAVNNFRKNVLDMSDDLYALLERRMAAKNYVISRMRLLPFAVELYALERLMISQAGTETASI